MAPGWQQRGIGTLLLRDGLATVDAAGGPSYLETGNVGNIGWYAEHGFAVDPQGDAARWPGGPTMWRMRREARTARA